MDYLQTFLIENDYASAARLSLCSAYTALFNQLESASVFKEQKMRYINGMMDYKTANTAIEAAAHSAGIHPFTALLLFYILLTEPLRAQYEKRKLPQDVFENTVRDLWYKAQECKAVYGVWGISVAWWQEGFFNLTRFALGRLQFELVPMPCNCIVKGRTILKGQTCLNVHIPSAGKLYKEDCIAAFAKAKLFFSQETAIFICDSWLLYPAQKQFLPPESSLLMFMDFFEIISSKTDPDFRNAWRIFGKDAVPPYTDLPQTTSLQKAYIKWLQAGNPVGTALGVMIL